MGGDFHILFNDLIKGRLRHFINVIKSRVLKSGGYLVIDELENHFNKEIAAALIRFFMDAGMNCMGGTLIFTTHYPELLDEFERNDCIYIIRNRDGITVSNLTDILKRNDLKKSGNEETRKICENDIKRRNGGKISKARLEEFGYFSAKFIIMNYDDS